MLSQDMGVEVKETVHLLMMENAGLKQHNINSWARVLFQLTSNVRNAETAKAMGVAYKQMDGSPLESLPADLRILEQIYKVPATDVEALKSKLMGPFEKRSARKFFIYVQDYEENDPKSHKGLDLNRVTTRDVLKCGLDDNTVDFSGHALSLHEDDSYWDQPAMESVKR